LEILVSLNILMLLVAHYYKLFLFKHLIQLQSKH